MLEVAEAEAVAAIALMAALADGRAGSEEREQIKALFESLGAEGELPTLAQVHSRVILKKTSLAEEAGKLGSEDARRTAFEVAVCVADADGVSSEAERAFLEELEGVLGLGHEEAVGFEREADAVAAGEAAVSEKDEPLDAGVLLDDEAGKATGAGAGAGAGLAAAGGAVSAARVEPGSEPMDAGAEAVSKEVDSAILKYAVLNGALELLPQNLATMAILPLQTRMVYAIGKKYGYSLGAGHIKEFIATLGLGATSQMLENFARKAIGKLAKRALGKTAGKVGKAATGPMMTFATTYAIGRVAKAYYSGGRTLSSVDLRSLFQRDVAEGRTLFESYRPQIERNAQTIKPGAVLDMVRGKGGV